MGAVSAKDFVINIVARDEQARKVMEGFKTVAVGAAAGIAAAWAKEKIGSVVGDSMDIGQSNARLAAELGTFAEDARKQGTLAGDLWSEGFADRAQVNDAIAAVRQNLGSLSDGEMKDVANKALVISDVFEQDVSRTAGAAAAIMRNDLAPSIADALDVITSGLQSPVNRADDLLDTFTEYSPFFAKLGLDAKSSLGILNQGMIAGARNSDFLADALKEFTIRGQEPVVRTAAEQAAALERVKSAGESLVTSQRSELAAQNSLNAARAQASQRLKDMADQLVGAALSERSATLAKDRAEQQLNATMRDARSTSLDRAEAELAYEQATYNLEQQQKAVVSLKDEKAAADAAGVDGADSVLAAQDALASAQKAVADAAAEVTAANANAADRSTALGKAYRRLGINGEWAANAIATGGPEAKKALQMVLDGLNSIEDPVQRNALAVQFFGTKAEDLQGALYALDTNTAAQGMDQVGGAAYRVAKAIEDGPTSKVEGLRRGVQSWLSGLVDMGGPLGGVATFLSAFGGDLVSLVAGLGPAALLMGGLATGSNAASVGMTGLGTAIKATGIGALVVIIATLVAQFVEWLTQTEDGKKAWEGFVGFLGDAWRNLSLGFQILVQGLGDWWGQFTGGIGDGVDWIGDRVGDIIRFFTEIPNRIGDGWRGFTDLVRGVLLNVMRFTLETWNNTLGQINFDLPWFLGGGHIQFPRFSIPALAEGGVVTGPTLALIGEAGPEAVVPLSQAGDYGLGGDDGDTFVHNVLKLDGRTVYETVERHKRKRR
ncbi:MAG: hypothetical protein J0I33_00140 [Microbacterium ginsengisoli]|uniref:phage tail tape measure protein n=1 Tax=Microbacterium TaxID=33882 RepID=UPI0006F9B250|nr:MULTISPECIES: phage tail tape measure protein [unclassified Microbacterium]KQR91284.1 hypothetical protein ASF93_08025 [Microbacterium sp. Leaf347]KQS01272.1 hypothetical protein ASG00_10855 [Microbacterium sp. Leaf351]MBN9197042.1 hypothetical protein [Microbacterium ginsengisoli]OJU77000.1 MAG: hypothetical protein BGO15_05710 [Microbacterium sp. 71-23]